MLVNYRNICKTSVLCLNQKWRKERGLPLDPYSYGVLTDTPDYSYLDGRSTPYGVGQRRRQAEQKQLAQQIIELTKEIDFAVNRNTKLIEGEKITKENIISNKLIPKGIALLKKKH